MVATRKIITFKMRLQWFPRQKAKMSTNNKIWHIQRIDKPILILIQPTLC